MEQEIKELLERELPGAYVEVARDADSGKIGGRVIWEGFVGYNSRRRQDRVFSLLRRNLDGAQTRANISYIFTYTPDEYAQAQVA